MSIPQLTEKLQCWIKDELYVLDYAGWMMPALQRAQETGVILAAIPHTSGVTSLGVFAIRLADESLRVLIEPLAPAVTALQRTPEEATSPYSIASSQQYRNSVLLQWLTNIKMVPDLLPLRGITAIRTAFLYDKLAFDFEGLYHKSADIYPWLHISTADMTLARLTYSRV